LLKNLSPQDRATIETVIKANAICREAASKSVGIVEMIKEAQAICPNHCPLTFLIMFESISVAAAFSDNLKVAAGIVLRDAVESGRKLVTLLQVNQFCKGNLFSYEPTRNYIRALYLRGSYLFRMGKLEEAYHILQECIANDIHDKLGARHKQLLVILEVGSINGKCDKRLPDLLEATFGDDQKVDDVLALWNYTRALYNFIKEGKSKKSRRILNHAIERNPFVPPLLLRYDTEVMSWAKRKIMCIGGKTEANDYVQDNRCHWRQTEGSLEWLRDIYTDHKKAIIPEINKAGAKLLSKGNKLFATRDSSDLKKAIVKYKDLLKIAETKKKYSTMRILALERIGCCYKFLGNSVEAMQYFNDALSCEKALENNKDLHKDILYQTADCKEEIEDYEGALECYRLVFKKMGTFTVAVESVKRIEVKMGRESGVIPAGYDVEPPSESEKDMEEDSDISDLFHSMMAEEAKAASNVEGCYHNMERCFHCKRGGVKLSFCSLCKDEFVKYCSKACQKSSWHDIHKYICRGSKFKIDDDDTAIIKGLEKSPHINGMEGKVVKYSEEKKRFIVCLIENGSEILVKPQNIEIVGA